MRTCPHCAFLVPEGATTCAVCHQDLAAAPVEVPAGSVFAAAPGAPAAPSADPWPSAFPPPYPGAAAPIPPAAPERGNRTRVWVIAAVVGVLSFVALGALVAGALTFLGTTAQQDVAADALRWRAYGDPDGRFSVDLPGNPNVDTVELPGGFGARQELEVVNVPNSRFGLTITPFEDAVGDGLTFDDVPFSPDAAERGAAGAGFDDPHMISHSVVERTGATQMQAELTGTVDGDGAVMLSRLVLVGPDMYEISIIGPSDQRDELVKIHDQVIASFRAPAEG